MDRRRNTPRQNRDANAALFEADNFERGQRVLRILARHWRAGTIPNSLRELRQKSRILNLVRHRLATEKMGYYDIIDSGEYADTSELGCALQQFLADNQAEPSAEDADARRRRDIDAKVAQLRLLKIEGFFPTPPAVAQRMLDLADVTADMDVLEPSAGTGDLAAMISDCQPHCRVSCIEVRPQLAEVCRFRGLNCTVGDFLELAQITQQRYDRVLMNPPFERDQYAVHIREAFRLLRIGGRLVSVVPNSLLTKQSGKAAALRAWYSELPHDVYQLPQGAFESSGTGVSVSLLVIDNEGIQL